VYEGGEGGARTMILAMTLQIFVAGVYRLDALRGLRIELPARANTGDCRGEGCSFENCFNLPVSHGPGGGMSGEVNDEASSDQEICAEDGGVFVLPPNCG